MSRHLWAPVAMIVLGLLPCAHAQELAGAAGQLLATAELSTDLFVGGLHASRSSGLHVGQEGETIVREIEALALWDVTTGENRLRLADKGTALAFSLDGRFLATSRGTDLHHGGKLHQAKGVVPGDGQLRLWELASGQEVLAFPAAVQPAVLAFAPDGRTLATGAKDGQVLLWNLAPRANGKALAVLDDEGYARLWSDLGSDDAALAYRALFTLKAAGPNAIARLKDRLQPAPADDPHQRKLANDLSADAFATREAAMLEFARRGASPALALRQSPAAEVRQRLLALLGAPGISDYPEMLGARGPSPCWKRATRRTQEAKAALERVRHRGKTQSR